MSTWDSRAFTCPDCETRGAITLARGVHGSRVPAVRRDVLARAFHRATCAGCGATIEVRRTLLYTDLERGHWVLVAAPRELARWPELEVELRAGVERGFGLGSPLAATTAPRRVRLVIGYEGLREKLVLWQAGLDDALVECMKVRLVASEPALAAPGSLLTVDAIGDGDELTVAWWPDATAAAPTRRVVLPGAWLVEADRDRDALRARFPELFAGGFVSIHRLLGPRYST